MDISPFHEDEITAQQRAHAHPQAAGIRSFMPDQHRAFFSLPRYLFVAVPDGNGWPLATVLTGPAGFAHSPTPTVLRVDALPLPADPAAVGFRPDNQVGILGLDLATRRRNRVNGRIGAIEPEGFSVDVAQSFGNCAQYIQSRTIRTETGRSDGETGITIDGIDEDARRLIRASDTFFVASRSRTDVGYGGGFDISHRGGMPGFVRVEANILTIPDFKGNRFFNTLGNLTGDDRCGLLFIEFETGDLLQAVGTVTIAWDSDAAHLPQGAQRSWRITIARSWWRRGALPFTFSFGDYAPTTLATGTW